MLTVIAPNSRKNKPISRKVSQRWFQRKSIRRVRIAWLPVDPPVAVGAPRAVIHCASAASTANDELLGPTGETVDSHGQRAGAGAGVMDDDTFDRIDRRIPWRALDDAPRRVVARLPARPDTVRREID